MLKALTSGKEIMLIPTRDMNLDYCLLSVTALILKAFSKQPLIGYDELLEITTAKIGKYAKEMTPYAVDFLFLLGKIEYHPDIDAFEITP
jgi:hypothetical protein